MSKQPTSGLSDNPIVVIIGVIASLIAVIVFLTGKQGLPEFQGNTSLTSAMNTPLPSASSTPSVDYSDIVGTYTGISYNKTGNASGMTTFDIRAVEKPYGKVRAELGWSQGLYGDGSIFGTIDQQGSMNLSGTILSNVTGIWDVDVNCSTIDINQIKCTYRLYPKPGNPNGTQDGDFTVFKK